MVGSLIQGAATVGNDGGLNNRMGARKALPSRPHLKVLGMNLWCALRRSNTCVGRTARSLRHAACGASARVAR